MFGPVRKISNDTKTWVAQFNPRHKCCLFSLRRGNVSLGVAIAGQPVAPQPFIKVIHRYGAVQRSAPRLPRVHLVVKIPQDHSMEFSRRGDLERERSFPWEQGGCHILQQSQSTQFSEMPTRAPQLLTYKPNANTYYVSDVK